MCFPPFSAHDTLLLKLRKDDSEGLQFGHRKMDRRSQLEDDLRAQLLPSRSSGSEPARLVSLPYDAPTAIDRCAGDLPENLVEYLDLNTPLPTDQRFSTIMSQLEGQFVEHTPVNRLEERSGVAAYCFFILVYTAAIGILVWINPEIRLGWLLLAPFPLYIPCVFRWWRQQQPNERLVAAAVGNSHVPVR